MPKLDQMMTYIPPDLKRKAKAKAALEDVSMTGLVCEWLRLWIEGKLPTPKVKEEKRDVKRKN